MGAFLNRTFQRLSVAQRFQLLIALVVIAAAVPATFFVQLQRTSIQTATDEALGISEAQLAMGAIQAVSATRPDPEAGGAAVAAVDALLGHIRQHRPALLATAEAWGTAAKSALSSADKASLDSVQKDGIALRDALLDASTLSLDPEAHTYNLMVYATAVSPVVQLQWLELEGRLVALLSQPSLSVEDRLRLHALISTIQDLSGAMEGQSAKVRGLVGPAADRIAASSVRLAQQSRDLAARVDRRIETAPVQGTWLAGIRSEVAQLQGGLQTLNQESWVLLDQLLEQRKSALIRDLTQVIAFIAVVVVCSAGVAYMSSKSIRSQLGGEPHEVMQIIRAVSDGDLSRRKSGQAVPEGSILAGVGLMQQTLSGMVSRLSESANRLAEATAQLAAGQADLSSRTERQASALEQTSASTEQLLSTIRQNLDQVEFAGSQGELAKRTVDDGSRGVGSIVETMKSISDSSRRVMDITGAIDGIAFQTNILALNAAVEAARAGEQGRGFAVVASEVRALAQRAAVSAKEIKSLIDTSIHTVDQGTDLVGSTGETMQRVVEQVDAVGKCMAEIRVAATEQGEGIQQVNAAVTEMDMLTQQNAAMVEEMAATAGSIADEAKALREIVSYFRLDMSLPMARA